MSSRGQGASKRQRVAKCRVATLPDMFLQRLTLGLQQIHLGFQFQFAGLKLTENFSELLV